MPTDTRTTIITMRENRPSATEKRNIRPRRIWNASNVDEERGLARKIPRTSPVFVPYAWPLLIAALISIKTTPLPTLAFRNQCGITPRTKRIRTRPGTECKYSEHRKRERINAMWETSKLRCPPPDFRCPGLSSTRLSVGNAEMADEENNAFETTFDDETLDSSFLDDEDMEDTEFIKKGLERLESMEKMLEEIDEYCSIEGMCDDDDDEDFVEGDDEELIFMGDVDELENIDTLLDFLEDSVGSVEDAEESLVREEEQKIDVPSTNITVAENSSTDSAFTPKGLEEALLQGVVPVEAGVGSNTLPGDFGFDPFGFAEKDYVKQFQYRFLNALPGGNPDNDPPPPPRPSALVLRDYREAEIRHGRLAMLAVVIWPIQEKLDQLLLESNQCGPILYGPITLPYFPLFMTLLMMLLGYLDIYAKDIQEEEGVGDAFLPGDCFWDPLRMLDGAPASMKRNMQERELFNGRVAMLAFAAFVFEEATSHEAIVDIPGNALLFVPAYQIPPVQEWLDAQFLSYAPIQ